MIPDWEFVCNLMLGAWSFFVVATPTACNSPIEPCRPTSPIHLLSLHLRWPQRNATLSVGRLLRSLYLLYLSQPASRRGLYKAVRARPVRSIVELGVGLGGRTERILEIAAWRAESLRYTGIDLFEARPAGTQGFSLKEAYAQLRLPRVRVQLVPGDPYTALMRVANALAGTDLLLISANQNRDSLARAWTWVPRMLTPTSLVFLEEAGTKEGQTHWRQVPADEIQRLATAVTRSQRRAA